jgi:hypothetical protein
VTKSSDVRVQPIRQVAISIFILFNLVAITCWVIPGNVPVLGGIKDLVRPYLAWSGLFQSWDTFAPNPKDDNSYIKTVVITQNHHLQVWTFPRMEQLSLAERYRKERYRKFIEVVPDSRNAVIWPDIAKHLAWQFRSPTDPPDKVVLINFQSWIQPGVDEAHTPNATPTIFYDDYVPAENSR